MLDHVLELTRHRRAGAAAHELTLLEHVEVDGFLDQLAHRAGPERASDDGGGLKRRLLSPRKEIDASGEHGTHRVWHGKASGELAECPAAVSTRDHAAVDKRGDQLLDEERIPFCALEDQLANGDGTFPPEVRRDQLVRALR